MRRRQPPWRSPDRSRCEGQEKEGFENQLDKDPLVVRDIVPFVEPKDQGRFGILNNLTFRKGWHGRWNQSSDPWTSEAAQFE